MCDSWLQVLPSLPSCIPLESTLLPCTYMRSTRHHLRADSTGNLALFKGSAPIPDTATDTTQPEWSLGSRIQEAQFVFQAADKETDRSENNPSEPRLCIRDGRDGSGASLVLEDGTREEVWWTEASSAEPFSDIHRRSFEAISTPQTLLNTMSANSTAAEIAPSPSTSTSTNAVLIGSLCGAAAAILLLGGMVWWWIAKRRRDRRNSVEKEEWPRPIEYPGIGYQPRDIEEAALQATLDRADSSQEKHPRQWSMEDTVQWVIQNGGGDNEVNTVLYHKLDGPLITRLGIERVVTLFEYESEADFVRFRDALMNAFNAGSAGSNPSEF